MKPSDYPNALWCAEVVDVVLFNHVQNFQACPFVYPQCANITDMRFVFQHLPEPNTACLVGVW